MAKPQAKTVLKKNRQDVLREWLSNKCTAQHLVNNIEKIENLDPASETFVNELNKLKVANEQRLKILDKYLPSLKSMELLGELGHTLKEAIPIGVQDAS